jgi:hypothetical protein
MIHTQEFNEWDNFYCSFKSEVERQDLFGRSVQFAGNIDGVIHHITSLIIEKIKVTRASSDEYETSENRYCLLSEISDVFDVLSKNRIDFDPENFIEEMRIINMHDAGTLIQDDFDQVLENRKLLNDDLVKLLASRSSQYALAPVVVQTTAQTIQPPTRGSSESLAGMIQSFYSLSTPAPLSLLFKRKPSMDNISAVINSIHELQAEYADSTNPLHIDKNNFLGSVLEAINRRETEVSTQASSGNDSEASVYGVDTLKALVSSKPKVLNGRVGKIIAALEQLELNAIESHFSNTDKRLR